ncbi:MAG: HNH endonuclease, partial [Actinobacteria bacterium]|nr:HNH endonuclease [Actinomycetota bacterium]
MVDIAGIDECWLWTGPVRKGYGAIGEGGGHGRTLRANRVAWELANGQEIPNGTIVRHTCDVPLCCNPRHLVLGTHAENSRDRVERGRHVRGAGHPRSRLTEQDAAEIVD